MPILAVNGVELFYEDIGRGPPLLFHHGYTASRESWEFLISRLADRYRCLPFDCRGAGDSARPQDGYTVQQYADDALALAAALGLDRFTFIGHSMGGAVGFHLAVHHPGHLQNLILIAPTPADGGELSPEDRQARLAPWYARDRELLIQQRLLGSARPPDRATAERRTDRALSVSEGHLLGSLDSMEAQRLADRLPEVHTPTLIVAAAADALLPHNLADFQRLPNASLHVFSRVGHGIPSEVPAALARVIPDFLAHGVVTVGTLLERAQAATPQNAQ